MKSFDKKFCVIMDKKYPKISKTYNNFRTEGFALAVFEELLFCILICFLSIQTDWYVFWLGGLIACTVHFVLHIGQAVVIRKYIPALATSILVLLFCIKIIYKSLQVLRYSNHDIWLYSVLGIVIVVINLKFAHILMQKFSFWIVKK